MLGGGCLSSLYLFCFILLVGEKEREGFRIWEGRIDGRGCWFAIGGGNMVSPCMQLLRPPPSSFSVICTNVAN